jgi:hypothetical protein
MGLCHLLSGHHLFFICSSISPSLTLRFFLAQLSQEHENIDALEIGVFLTSGTFQDPRQVRIILRRKGSFLQA